MVGVSKGDPFAHYATSGGVKRLATIAGAPAIGAEAKSKVKSYIKALIEDMVDKSVIYAEHARHKTLHYSDLMEAIRNMGMKMYGSKDMVYEKCIDLPKSRSGQLALTSKCVFMAKSPFAKFVRKHSGTKLEKAFVENLQHFVEMKTIEKIGVAVELMIGAKRSTLKASDFHFVDAHDCKPSVHGKVPLGVAKTKRKKRAAPKKAAVKKVALKVGHKKRVKRAIKKA